MAGLGFTAKVVDNALAAATAETVLMIKAPTNQRVKLSKLTISFDGTSATATPVLIELGHCSSDGTMTSVTPVKRNESHAETVQTACYSPNSAEPAYTSVFRSERIHPQTNKEIDFYPEQEIKGGGRLGVRVTAAAAVNCTVTAECEE